MITIRKASPHDAHAMARVLVDAWFAAHAAQVSPEVLQKRQEEWGYVESERGWRRAIREAEGSSSVVLVAADGDQILGMLASELTGADSVEVGALYVDVSHQRTGIGRTLLQAAMNHYRDLGMARLRIAVLATNHPARSFYEALGGEVSGFRDDDDGLEVVYAWHL